MKKLIYNIVSKYLKKDTIENDVVEKTKNKRPIINISNLKLEKFENWLIRYGCEILQTVGKNEYFRFKGCSIGIIYKNGKTNNIYTNNAIECYKNGKPWGGGANRVKKRKSSSKFKKKLLDREGTKCFYCNVELGDDVTVEHIISLVSGGSYSLVI